MKDVLTLHVNGDALEVGVPAHATLLETLRYTCGFTGSKQGCDKGDCGACTVLLDGEPFLSCIMPVYEALGHEITTVEGLAEGRYPHPLQDAFDLCGAAQCGFCTPGILCSAYALLLRNTNPGRAEIQQALSGNLCRCTGYTKIFEAVEVAAEALRRGRDPRDVVAERYALAFPSRSMQPASPRDREDGDADA
ncbi:MAG: (2Fe-2S)-binding protein [Gemmatimonadota bacterium]|jgi:carbon-monoxide dehydrogenase small subunit|nr:MAG: (2Fe-2S)-binding protein [Gemmatimonadota bacterium]